MPSQSYPRRTSGGSPGGAGLRLMAALIGIFLIATGVTLFPWVTDSGILLQRFQQWLQSAIPSARWYLETVCMPGAPIFARLVPVGACCAGAALIAGFWTRMAAIATLLIVLNAHFVSGALWSPHFLTDGTGLPLLGGLLALAISGSRLPFSLSK